VLGEHGHLLAEGLVGRLVGKVIESRQVHQPRPGLYSMVGGAMLTGVRLQHGKLMRYYLAAAVLMPSPPAVSSVPATLVAKDLRTPASLFFR